MLLKTSILALLLSLCPVTLDDSGEWGFYGHRLINETAVFTLPADLIPLYKSNLQFVRDHAVDPDKRRYASKLEAVRHYIDLDIWGEYPFAEVLKTHYRVGKMMRTGQNSLLLHKGRSYSKS